MSLLRLWARRARLVHAIEDEGMKRVCDMRRMDWLSRALCRVEERIQEETR